MALLPLPVEALLTALSKLPGIGPRSAERIALHIVQSDPGAVQELARALVNAREQVAPCSELWRPDGAATVRHLLRPKREPGLVCVVERPVDIISLEKSGAFRGRYHVLGGKISPLNGIGPEDLRVAELEQRISSEDIQEVIIALPSDVEGDATSFYLASVSRGGGESRAGSPKAFPSGAAWSSRMSSR